MWLIDLPIEEADPLRRMQLIKERTLNLKKTNQALGAATLVEVSSGHSDHLALPGQPGGRGRRCARST